MKKLSFLLFVPILFLQFILLSSSQAAGEKVDVAFPFFDDVEDSATTYSNWDRDETIWDIRITNAQSGQQV